MSSAYIFNSERLGFRNWQDSDLKALAKMNADPRVMEYFPSTVDEIETAKFIARMQAEFAKHNFCYFAVDLLSSNEFIGFIGLSNKDFEADFTPCVDIGWRIDPDHWGKGYATEGAKACLDYGFNTIALTSIVSMAPKINKKSIAVMKKIGMQFETEFDHPALLDDERLKTCVLYKIERNES